MLCKNESHDNGRGQYISCVVLFIGCDGCMTSKSQKLVLPHKKKKISIKKVYGQKKSMCQNLKQIWYFMNDNQHSLKLLPLIHIHGKRIQKSPQTWIAVLHYTHCLILFSIKADGVIW